MALLPCLSRSILLPGLFLGLEDVLYVWQHEHGAAEAEDGAGDDAQPVVAQRRPDQRIIRADAPRYGHAEQLRKAVDGHGHADQDIPEDVEGLELVSNEIEQQAAGEERDIDGEAPGAHGHLVAENEQAPLGKLVTGDVVRRHDDAGDLHEGRVARGKEVRGQKYGNDKHEQQYVH